jgi:hypothetical protein
VSDDKKTLEEYRQELAEFKQKVRELYARFRRIQTILHQQRVLERTEDGYRHSDRVHPFGATRRLLHTYDTLARNVWSAAMTLLEMEYVLDEKEKEATNG